MLESAEYVIDLGLFLILLMILIWFIGEAL